MRRAAAPIAAALLAAAAAGCGPAAAPDEPATTASFLEVQGYVSLENGVLQGYMRWAYLADDPAVYADPRLVCETWEELSGAWDGSASEEDCPGCGDAYDVSATLASTSCQGDLADHPDGREFHVAFAPLDPEASPLESRLHEEGFTHLVWSTWAPDGALEPMEAVFGAYPLVWSGGGGSPGQDDGDGPKGEFELFSLYYWSLEP